MTNTVRYIIDVSEYESSLRNILRLIKQLPSKIKFMKKSVGVSSKGSRSVSKAKPAVKAVKGAKGTIKLKSNTAKGKAGKK